MQISQKKISIGIISLLAQNVVFANQEMGQLVLTGMIGIANMQQNDATFALTNDETDELRYTNTQSWDAWSLQLGAGYRVPLDFDFNENKDADDIRWLSAFTPQVNFYILNNADLNGEVYRFQDIDNNDAAYNMKFNSTRIMLDGVLNIATLRKVSLYGIAGIGIASSDLNLELTPYSDNDLEPLHFVDEANKGLAYEFGAGLSYRLNHELDISLQYLYTAFSDLEISGQDDIFTISDSNLDISSQSLSLGFNLSV